MKITTIGEIQKNFGKILKEINSGEEVMITRRGKPVAKLTVLGPKKNIDWPDFDTEAVEAEGKPTSQLVTEERGERL